MLLGVYPPFSTQLPQYKCLLGATSIEKIPKISASGRNFLDPLPLLKFLPYRRKRQYFVPKSNYKVRIFPNFKPPSPYFGRMPNLTDDVNWGGHIDLYEAKFKSVSTIVGWESVDNNVCSVLTNESLISKRNFDLIGQCNVVFSFSAENCWYWLKFSLIRINVDLMLWDWLSYVYHVLLCRT